MFEFALIHYRKIFGLRLFDFTGIYSNPFEVFSEWRYSDSTVRTCLHSLEEASWRQVSRGYARSCTSDPAPSIVSRLRKAVLSRIIRLHRIIAYTGRDRRTPVARLHLFSTTVCFPHPAILYPWRGRLIHSRRKWLERDWKSIRFSSFQFYSKS